jgi:hypothetical protein
VARLPPPSFFKKLRQAVLVVARVLRHRRVALKEVAK